MTGGGARAKLTLLKTAATSRQGAEYPPGLKHAYFFAVFNALSFQMILNSPMVLYAKSLGATATVLGIDPSLPEALRGKDLQAALHVLTADGRVYNGAEAFRFMGLRLPLVALPTLALFLPGMLPLAAMIYRWVSSHRHPLSHWLDAIHARDL